MANVILAKSAERSFSKLRSSDKLKISRAIDALEMNPLIGKKLHGKFEGLYSVRAWPYRLIYQFFPKQKLVEVVIIEHRQGAYK